VKVNEPVTQIETLVDEEQTLVSKTDLKGIITDVNANFEQVLRSALYEPLCIDLFEVG
jgi:hypothetical protein